MLLEHVRLRTVILAWSAPAVLAIAVPALAQTGPLPDHVSDRTGAAVLEGVISVLPIPSRGVQQKQPSIVEGDFFDALSPGNNWNRLSKQVIQGPDLGEPEPDEEFVEPKCKIEPTTAAGKAVVAAGWSLVDYFDVQQPLVAGKVEVVMATAATDFACRPEVSQGFAFFDGQFIGTLTPRDMSGGESGRVFRVRILTQASVEVDLHIYQEDDQHSFPSFIKTLRFAITNEPGIPTFLNPISLSGKKPHPLKK